MAAPSLREQRQEGRTVLTVNALFAILLAVMGTAAVFAFRNSLDAIRYPFQIDYGEGIVLWQTQHLNRLDTAYTPVTPEHVVVFHYPPLYHYAARLGARVTGDLLIAGRAVSTAASLVVAFLVLGQLIYAAPEARNWTSICTAGLAALLCYLSANQRLWSRVMRVDTLGVAFAFGGVFLFTLAWRYKNAIWLASVLFVLAAFTKQTLVAAPLACLLVALVLDRRKALQLVLATGALASAALLLLTDLTHGEFLKHTAFHNRSPFSLHPLLQLWRANLTGKAAITALAVTFVAYLAATLWRQSGSLQQDSSEARFSLIAATWSVYFLLSFVMTLSAGKQGAAFNYFIEWNAVSAVMAGLAFLLLVKEIDLSRRSLALFLAMAFPIMCVGESALAVKSALTWLPDASHPDWRANEQIIDLVRQTKGPVFSDAMLLVVKGGKAIEGEPAVMANLSGAGVWNQAGFVAKIRRGYFDRVITADLSEPIFFTPEIRKAIEETYSKPQEIGPYQVFEKR